MGKSLKELSDIYSIKWNRPDLPPWFRLPVSVMEKWMWDEAPPEAKRLKWSNCCMGCKAPDYEPFGPQLLHYCKKCAKVCTECGYPKPTFAFPFDTDSEAFKEWALKTKGVRPPPRPPIEAHIDTCNYCMSRRLEALDAQRRDEEKRITRAVIDAPSAQAALNLMLGKG